MKKFIENVKNYAVDFATEETAGPTIEQAAIIALAAVLIVLLFTVIKPVVQNIINNSGDKLGSVNDSVLED